MMLVQEAGRELSKDVAGLGAASFRSGLRITAIAATAALELSVLDGCEKPSKPPEPEFELNFAMNQWVNSGFVVSDSAFWLEQASDVSISAKVHYPGKEPISPGIYAWAVLYDGPLRYTYLLTRDDSNCPAVVHGAEATETVYLGQTRLLEVSPAEASAGASGYHIGLVLAPHVVDANLTDCGEVNSSRTDSVWVESLHVTVRGKR